MSTEPIDIVVTETGTQELINLLQQLGVTADQATARVATGFNRASTSQQGLVSNSVLLSRAAQANSVDIGLLGDALDKLTSAELNAAARSDVLSGAWKAEQAAATGAAAAVDALAAAQTREGEAAAASAKGNAAAAEATEAGGEAAAVAGGKFKALQAALVGIAAYAGAHELATLSDEMTDLANKVGYANSATGGLNATIREGGGHVISFGGALGNVNSTVTSAGSHIIGLHDALTSLSTVVTAGGSSISAFKGVTDGANTSFIAASTNLAKARQALADYDSGVTKATSSTTGLVHGFEAQSAGNAAIDQSYRDLAQTTNKYFDTIDSGITSVGKANAASDQRSQLVAAEARAQDILTAAVKAGSDGLSVLTSQSKPAQDAFNSLAQNAVRNGQEIEGAVQVYSQLRIATAQLGVTNEQAITTTEGLSDIFKISGVSAANTSRAVRELAQGFNSGVLEGRQFQALEREAPAVIRAISDATGQSVEQLKENGITVQAFVSSINQVFPQLEEQAKSTVGTLSGAFTAVKDQFLLYVGTSQTAYTATGLLAQGIRSIGNNIGVVVPAVGLLAGAFAAVKVGELVGDIYAFATAEKAAAGATAALEFALSPVGILIGAIVGTVAYLVDGYANYKVATGDATTKTEAFKQILGEVETAFQPILDVIKNFVIQGANFISFLTGSTTHANDLGGAIKVIGEALQAVAPYIAAFGTTFLNVLNNIYAAAYNLGKVIGNLVSSLAGVPTGILDGTIAFKGVTDPTAGTPASTPNRDGGVYQMRDGGSVYGDGFRVPGADRPDTVPVNLMVSRGERIMVQTEAQQAKHDAIMDAYKRGAIHAASGAIMSAEEAAALTKFENGGLIAQRLLRELISDGYVQDDGGNYSIIGTGATGDTGTGTGTGGGGSATPIATAQQSSSPFIRATSNSTTGYQGFDVRTVTAARDGFEAPIHGTLITGPPTASPPPTGFSLPGGIAGVTSTPPTIATTPVPAVNDNSGQTFSGSVGNQFIGDGGNFFGIDDAREIGLNAFTLATPSISVSKTTTVASTGSGSTGSGSTGTVASPIDNTQHASGGGEFNGTDWVDNFAALAANYPFSIADIAYNKHGLVPYPSTPLSTDYTARAPMQSTLPFTDGNSVNVKDLGGNDITANAGAVPGIPFPLAGGLFVALPGAYNPSANGLGSLNYEGSSGWFGESINDYFLDITGYPVTASTITQGQTTLYSNKDVTAGQNNKYRDGGMIYARDGADFMVPGADAVDSRILHMAVSPGERVQVHTPDQQSKNGQGNTVNNFNTTVHTKDAASFKPSERQLGQRIARTMKRAGVSQ